jgi:translation initiation factor 1
VGRDSRRAQDGPPASGTRLVYSTGGEKPTPQSAVPEVRGVGGKGVRLRLEPRPGGRSVTLVLGLPGGEAEWAALATALKSACSAGGGVKDGVIELQGDQREKAKAALAARGIKSR